MSVAKITFYFLLVTLLAVGVSTTAFAFHEGGVGECAGCHSMHSPAPEEPPPGRHRPQLGVPDLPRACRDTGLLATTSAPISRICRQYAPLQRTPAGTSVG